MFYLYKLSHFKLIRDIEVIKVYQKISDIVTQHNIIKEKSDWINVLLTITEATQTINTSYGPKGFNKMIVYNRGPEQVVKITRNPIPVLEEISIKFPLMSVFSEAAKMQRKEYGDGAKYFTILLSSLLKNSLKLIEQGIHPNTILSGYQLAAEECVKFIDSNSNYYLNLEDLMDLIECGTKVLDPFFKQNLVKAYNNIPDKKNLKDKIKIYHKMGARAEESYLIEGIIIKKNKAHQIMPDQINDPRIALITDRIDLKRMDVAMKGEGPTPLEIEIKKVEDIDLFLNYEDKLRKELISSVGKNKIDVIICSNVIDEKLKYQLGKMGIIALESVERGDLNNLADATGAKIASKLKFIEESDLGSAQRIYFDKFFTEEITVLEGCKGLAIVSRSSTTQTKEVIDDILSNYFCLLDALDGDYSGNPGNGMMEILLYDHLCEYSYNFDNRKQLAIKYFANSLLELPKILANNYGFDRLDAVSKLTKYRGNGTESNELSSKPVYDSSSVKKGAIDRAFNVCSLLLKIDIALTSKGLVKFHQ